MNHTYVTVDRIFSRLNRDISSNFTEGDVIEWAGEALEAMETVKSYEEAVAFVEVENYTCSIPPMTHAIIQVARNNRFTTSNKDLFCPKAIKQVLENTTNTVDIPVQLDCVGQPINDYDLAYYRPYFDLRFEYEGWNNSGLHSGCFTPVRLKTNSFFETIVCKETNNTIYSSCKDEYSIVNKGTAMRFSFQKGQVAIAYLRQQVDIETGYPMIPDSNSHITAIVYYIAFKMFTREYFGGREAAQGKMKEAEKQWVWYCKQATNSDMSPYGVDEHQNLLDQRSYMLPIQNRYYNFFGNLAAPELRRWNNQINNTTYNG